MRLAVASPFLDRLHGTESCVVEQIERLAFDYGWEVHLYSQDVKSVPGVQKSASAVETGKGSVVWHRVPRIPGPHLLQYLWWFAANHVRRWIDSRCLRIKIDLTYSPGINCLDANVIVVHIVFHEFFERVFSDLRLRDTPITSWARVLHRQLYYKLAMLLENRVYRDSRVRLIAVSNLVARQLETHFGRTDVEVISNAVDTNRFGLEKRLMRRPEARESFGYSDRDFVLLLIGNDWKKKGLDALLRAFPSLCELPIRLLVIGSDDPRLYRQQVAECNCLGRVRFEPPSADVLSFYGAADVYVAPSLEDAFGLPILEAMACGLPVIASAYAGASEFIQDGDTGLILTEPRDPLEIVRGVKALYTDASRRARMGIAASQFVQNNCGWNQNALKTQRFLEATLQNRKI